ncbi:hypothetical protein C1T31_01235 [Hanstruepera neustonica]|uniref:Uncharacterized protein n=1 Tax=Hanstruepera neustonica TaxID=1445657 RepID=A0A2K1E3F3_9FLAO|nr:hypothetical protein [Hanstruepera neustonica]PNQ74793.1 hypothetical protein C1T31_01235 [Hanstruepera neustonica]
MNDNKQPLNTNDEVDLGQLFKMIGKAFDRLIKFVYSILKSLFSLVIFTIKPIIVNFKIIVITILIAGILGYALDKFKPKLYSSSMLVKPYFDSKYQLVNTIDYYNALIENEEYGILSNVFNLQEDEVEQISSFEISPGPETENERLIQYENFLKSIDSTRAVKITFEDFIENRSIYAGDLFEIKVYSSKKDIFPKLEEGLNGSFTNKYSEKKMKKRDSLITIQKQNIMQQLEEVASLQDVYIKVLEEESRTAPTEITIGGEGLTLNKDKTQTREFELLNTEIRLRNELKELDKQKVEEDVFFDVISSFQQVGKIDLEWYQRYKVVLPALGFVLLCIIYLTRKLVRFVVQYEA